MNVIKLNVDGMSCPSCVRHIHHALDELPGVEAVEVQLAAGCVLVASEGDVDAVVLERALDAAGYPARAVGRTAA